MVKIKMFLSCDRSKNIEFSNFYNFMILASAIGLSESPKMFGVIQLSEMDEFIAIITGILESPRTMLDLEQSKSHYDVNYMKTCLEMMRTLMLVAQEKQTHIGWE